MEPLLQACMMQPITLQKVSDHGNFKRHQRKGNPGVGE